MGLLPCVLHLEALGHMFEGGLFLKVQLMGACLRIQKPQEVCSGDFLSMHQRWAGCRALAAHPLLSGMSRDRGFGSGPSSGLSVAGGCDVLSQGCRESILGAMGANTKAQK